LEEIKMIYVFLANGFEEIEALTPVDILRRAEADVKTVGIGSKTIVSTHGVKVEADLNENELTTVGLEMIVLPGGSPGWKNLDNSHTVHSFIDYAYEKGIWIAAICGAPTIIGKKGMLKGKHAICFPGMEEQLLGAIISDEFVCEDDNFITAKGAGVSVEFGLTLVAKLKGKQRADAIKAQMQCKN
jgi:4-methyl-5(b-hydroxyethyl)-thiazole monophosphate biosynthesis